MSSPTPAPRTEPRLRERACDVVVVGTGPAALVAADRLRAGGLSVTVLISDSGRGPRAASGNGRASGSARGLRPLAARLGLRSAGAEPLGAQAIGAALRERLGSDVTVVPEPAEVTCDEDGVTARIETLTVRARFALRAGPTAGAACAGRIVDAHDDGGDAADALHAGEAAASTLLEMFRSSAVTPEGARGVRPSTMTERPPAAQGKERP